MSVSVVTVYLQRDPFIETGFSFTARGLRVCGNDHQHRKHTAGQNIMHELITVEVLIRAKFIQTVLSS